MKIPTLIRLIICLVLFEPVAPELLAQNTYSTLDVIGSASFNGAATFNGSFDITGTTATLGTWSGGYNGLTLNYSDGSATTGLGTVNFIGSGSSTLWQWWDYNGGAQPLAAMILNQNNQMILYSPGTGGSAGISLDPSSTGTSTFAGSLAINGTNSTLPNQTSISSSSSILTVGLADGRYVLRSTSVAGMDSKSLVGISPDDASDGDPFSLDGGDANGSFSIALGASSDAASDCDMALGENAQASGGSSLSIGYYSASAGSSSSAVGYNAVSGGNSSNAIGYWAYAGGDSSSAFGPWSNAGGDYSTALGYYASTGTCYASSFGSNANAFGQYSTAIGSYATAGYLGDTALGVSSCAAGGYSTALGPNSFAVGLASISLGVRSLAQEDFSTALGYNSTANGLYSTAAGTNTTATAYGQFVVGQYNLIQGYTYIWSGNDNLFVVGNGVDQWDLSNAFVVSQNGDTTVSGALAVSGTSGNSNTIYAGGLAVTGTSMSVPSGTVVVATGANNLLVVPQQGDLSMGPFVAGQQPPTATSPTLLAAQTQAATLQANGNAGATARAPVSRPPISRPSFTPPTITLPPTPAQH